MQKANKCKKYPCPDCNYCQWCDDSRCGKCRPPARDGSSEKTDKPRVKKRKGSQ